MIYSIICHDRYHWLQAAVELFKSDEFKVNPNYVRFLVWRNKQADILMLMLDSIYGVKIHLNM